MYLQSSDFTIFTNTGKLIVHKNTSPDWRGSLIDTGIDTKTGGRLLKIKGFIDEDTFMMTYDDGVSNINLNKLLLFHKKHGKIATLTAVRPPPRFGVIDMEETGRIQSFYEKPEQDGTWINGGFFVLNRNVFNYIGNDKPYFEDYPLRNLSKDGQNFAYKHTGFWRPMDTMSDKRHLEELWARDKAEWKIWNE